MCGIAGMFDRSGRRAASALDLRRMLAQLRHRGPDEFGILLDREAGLGNARLSIIDLSGGSQPIANEDESLWIVLNGEIFNYIELRHDLEERGHTFRTQTDTEVILHLYEDQGPACLEKLNGQFAIAIWDTRRRRLFLARDRLGVRPLFYTETTGATLLFGSEIKAILTDERISASLDPQALVQVFTFWSAQTPRTSFQGILELPPGHFLEADKDSVRIQPYWQCRFATCVAADQPRSLEQVIEEFRALLIDACRVRLRADVPVGCYLSGGLDSSTIASIVRRHTNTKKLETFSIAFEDEKFDESAFQLEMARHLGTDHHVIHAAHADIGRVFPDIVWHAETPLMRTAPAPMFLLSGLVRKNGYKVVLTGEGADEFLAGYDLFKEAKVRRFWARAPESHRRPLLLKRLYQDIGGLAQSDASYLAGFFGEGLGDVESPWYSHAVRWRNNRRTLRFIATDLLAAAEKGDAPFPPASLPGDFFKWDPLARAQYLEITTFLSPYLLSSQGDRMGMAHSVEGRFPFLDLRLVEFCNALPPGLKLRVLTEKFLLKEAARPWLPELIRQRPKRPYRAPIYRSFFNDASRGYVREALDPVRVKAAGYFKPGAVEQLVRKIDGGAALGETDDMALVGILSTQLWHERFVSRFSPHAPLSQRDPVKICTVKSIRFNTPA